MSEPSDVDGIEKQNRSSLILQPGRFVGPKQHNNGGKTDEEQYIGQMRQYILEQLVDQNPILQQEIKERRLQNIREAIAF